MSALLAKMTALSDVVSPLDTGICCSSAEMPARIPMACTCLFPANLHLLGMDRKLAANLCLVKRCQIRHEGRGCEAEMS